jgi:hypothetical protein
MVIKKEYQPVSSHQYQEEKHYTDDHPDQLWHFIVKRHEVEFEWRQR